MPIPYARQPVGQLPTDATRPTFATIVRLFAIEADRVLAILAAQVNTIVTVIATGHGLLSATHTDTLPSSPVRGGLVYGNATPAWAQLPVGAVGTFLESNGSDVSWRLVVAGYPTFGVNLSGQSYSP